MKHLVKSKEKELQLHPSYLMVGENEANYNGIGHVYGTKLPDRSVGC